MNKLRDTLRSDMAYAIALGLMCVAVGYGIGYLLLFVGCRWFC